MSIDKSKPGAGEIAPPKGKLGIMIPGMGAVATTFVAGVEAMRADGVAMPPLMVNGKPFDLPQVHPEAEPGARVGQGMGNQMRSRTVFTHRHNG